MKGSHLERGGLETLNYFGSVSVTECENHLREQGYHHISCCPYQYCNSTGNIQPFNTVMVLALLATLACKFTLTTN